MAEIPGAHATVVLLGTLDTKGHEYAFVRDRIRSARRGRAARRRRDPERTAHRADVTRQEVAAAAGADVQALADAGDRGAALEVMGRGATEVVLRLHAEGRFDAIGALGGTGGTTLATHVMRALPVGVPKLMVSTVASGDTSPYVGHVDVTMTYSVVDVAGINRISAKILANAAGTLVGMATEPTRGARRGASARRSLDVGRHDAVRDDSPGAPRGARLRRARLPPDRDGRRLDGGADQDRSRRRRARRHPDRARRRDRGRRLAGWSRAARGRRPPRDSPGRLPRRARPDRPRPSRLDARAFPLPLDLPPRRAHGRGANDSGGERRRSQRSSRESSTPPRGPWRCSCHFAASPRSRFRGPSSSMPRRMPHSSTGCAS